MLFPDDASVLQAFMSEYFNCPNMSEAGVEGFEVFVPVDSGHINPRIFAVGS